MTYEIKGDLQVKRTIIADRRVDQGLNAAVIVGAETLVRHSANWQALSAAGAQDVNLPDATTLPEGWRVVVHANGAADLTVKDAAAGTVEVVEAGRAYEFYLIDNSAAAGTWYVNFLENADVLPASRYTLTHNAVADWGAAAGGYYSITTTAATHGRGTRPTFQFFETSGANEVEVNPDQAYIITASGNVVFRVPDAPDLRYAGKVIFV
jgi:hypothetical protein